MWYIYTIEYYTAERKKELLPFLTSWMELDNIMLSEIRQSERQIPYDLTYKWNLMNKTDKPTNKQNRTRGMEIKTHNEQRGGGRG